MMPRYDVIVVGAGPNGLAAAAHLTRAGKRVLVVEGADEIGGGTRTKELTLPGFLHDVCSAIHPLGAGSPVFRNLGADIDWIHPEVPVAHPLGNGRSAGLVRDLDESARGFGPDEARYRRLMAPLVANADEIVEDFLRPVRMLPHHPGSFMRFASRAILPASRVIGRFETDEARAVFAGMAAHAIAPLNSLFTGGVALMFAATVHAFGWPMAKGGSQQISAALARVIIDGGGSIETGHMVDTLDEFDNASLFLLDVMPNAAIELAGDRLASGVERRLARRRYGPGSFKVDWALSDPIPWMDELSRRAGTVHVGGRFEEVMAAEQQVSAGTHPRQPFVLVAQQTLSDPTRAPEGKHTAWGYCHVPGGSTRDMTDAIESQIERFAPGFRDVILGRNTMNTADLENHNPNYVGGDIAGGAFGVKKLLQFGSRRPYRIGDKVFMCSSATPPGGGVHGLCGHYAAEAALSSLATR